MIIAGLCGWSEEQFWSSSMTYLEEAYEAYRVSQGAKPREALEALEELVEDAPKTRSRIV